MSVIDQVRGTEFRRLLKVDVSGGAVAPNWTTEMATFVFDGPASVAFPNGTRLVYKWRPAGGSDPEVALGPEDAPLIVIPTTETVDWPIGEWSVSVFYRDPTTNQVIAGESRMLVRDVKGGPPPVVV